MKVHSVEKRDGYEIRMMTDGYITTTPVPMAYTLDGHYIGNEKDAKLLEEMGIKPELASRDSNICSVGFCEREQKWYGWSHRAIAGYGIGDVAKEDDGCTQSGFTPEYEKAHPELVIAVPVGFEAKTLDDARRMAMAFAESVS